MRAETPIEVIKRLIANPAALFKPDKPAVRKLRARPADAELLAVMPLPRLRPAVAAVASPVLSYQGGEDSAAAIVPEPTDDSMPIPRLRPADLLPALSAPPRVTAAIAPPPPPEPPRQKAAVLPDSDTAAASPPEQKVASLPDVDVPTPPLKPLPELIRPPPAALSTCGMAIADLGVISKPLAPIKEGTQGECSVEMPVAVTALESGRIDLTSKAIIDCHTAERLATWVHDTVEPKVRAAYGGELTGLRIAASYACRNRDSLPDAKLSEHAHGNAIDISGFRVGKRWIEVGPGWSGGGDDLSFLTDVRKSACGPFSTVLGPGSDSFHTDHFHLDLIERRTAGPSKGLYCK